MNWYYKDKINLYNVGDKITIEGDEHHHLSRVRREKPNNNISIFDGRGICIETTIIDITKYYSRIMKKNIIDNNKR